MSDGPEFGYEREARRSSWDRALNKYGSIEGIIDAAERLAFSRTELPCWAIRSCDIQELLSASESLSAADFWRFLIAGMRVTFEPHAPMRGMFAHEVIYFGVEFECDVEELLKDRRGPCDLDAERQLWAVIKDDAQLVLDAEAERWFRTLETIGPVDGFCYQLAMVAALGFCHWYVPFDHHFGVVHGSVLKEPIWHDFRRQGLSYDL